MFAGDYISKIIVPHPALNFPKKITITYQVYRGWLTRGLSAWSISKVILGDSFGESYSLCKHFDLESGIPLSITLEQGDCHEEELLLLAEKASQEASAKLDLTKNTTEIYPTLNVTSDVMSLGKHIPLERNETESITTEKQTLSIINASWKPMINMNITKPASNESEEMDEKDLNIGERMPKKAKTDKRSFGELGEDDLMNSMPIRDDSSDMEELISDEDVAIVDENSENKFVTVQLFQYRLGDVFEKAEKYARFTLFPMLSEQISNIFNFDSTEKDTASTDNPIVVKSKPKSLRKYDIEEEIDVRSLQSMGLKLHDHIKPIEKLYNNYELRKEENDRKINEKIRVELPTYRPPEKEKVFIPIERNP